MLPAQPQHHRVWLLIVAMSAAAGVLYQFELMHWLPEDPAKWWYWPIAVAGFAIGDSVVVRVQFRAEITGFSFVELPLFIAAISLNPSEVMIALAIGVAISVFVIQRLTPMKALFNIANLSFQGAVALFIFHTILDGADAAGRLGWLAAAVAGTISSAIGMLGLLLVLTLVQGYDAITNASQTVFMSAVTGGTNVSLALLATTLINEDVAALVLLGLPTLVLFGAYRAFTSERQQRERVQAMHELALEVRSIRDQAGIVPVLQLVARYLGAHRASLVLFPDQNTNANAMRFSIAGEQSWVQQVVSADLAAVIDEVHGLPSAQLRQSAVSQGVEVAGAIHGEGRALGLLVVSDRLRNASEFSEGDVVMFETILEQLGLTFEKNNLGLAVTRLEHSRRELQHEASHDVLTGVANRALLASRLEEEIANHRRPSLLYVDLDDFKHINDRFGHDVGDQVLIEIATRFATVVGPLDCVARIGGDEFAVLLNESSDDVGVATALLEVAARPIETAAGFVRVRASIGLARSDRTTDPSSLLKRADVAMYDAKANGKGKLTLA